MLLLGIETSCDETAAAVVDNGRVIRSNVVASQAALHARYGGVVPEVASRQHSVAIGPMVAQALQDARVSLDDVDAVAVTYGPGLAGSLLVGVTFAKGLAFARGIPLVAVNHLVGHVYAGWLREAEEDAPEPEFPLLVLLVSGAHSDLALMTDHGQFIRLARTLDDAAGEAFDKVARMLGLGYPGGPAIQQAAMTGDPAAFSLPQVVVSHALDFSFSGLKTAMLRLTRQFEPDALPVADLAASFQDTVATIVSRKTVEAARQTDARQLLVVGGVAANARLRQRLLETSPIPVRWPKPVLCTDNGAMIAAAGYFAARRGERAPLDLDVDASLKLGSDTKETQHVVATY